MVHVANIQGNSAMLGSMVHQGPTLWNLPTAEKRKQDSRKQEKLT